MSDKPLIHYKHNRTYSKTINNAVGATVSTTLRTVTAHNDTNCKYVRKFGTNYSFNSITNIVVTTPRTIPGENWDYVIYGLKAGVWTAMARIQDDNGSSTGYLHWEDFATSKMKIVIIAQLGTTTIQDGDTLEITTDQDSPFYVYLSQESISEGSSLELFVSAAGSTYYDSNLIYGGYRKTPTGTSRYSYYSISTALAALGGGFTICTILDSATYDEELTISGGYTLQAALGQTPTITSGAGARTTREVSTQYNNNSAVYFNENGSDGTGDGTWQNPFKTPAYAITNRNSKHVVYGGYNAENGTNNETADINIDGFNFEADYGYTPTITNTYDSGVYKCQATMVFNASTDSYINGFIIECAILGYGIYFAITGADFTTYCYIINCTIKNAWQNGIYISKGAAGRAKVSIQKNIINNCNHGIQAVYISTANNVLDIKKNFIYNHALNGIDIVCYFDLTVALDIENNIIYNNSNDGIKLWNDMAAGTENINGAIHNNTLFNNTNCGIDIFSGGFTINATIEKMIFMNNVSYGIYSAQAVTINYCDFYGNGSKYNVNVTSNNEITTNPNFCQITSPYKFGLSANSGCLKTDGTENDRGAILNNLIVAANSITINGFNFDGQNSFDCAIAKIGTSDYTGLIVKWCTIYDYQGIAIDDYSGATTTSTIQNCILKENGNGLKFTRGGNTFQNNLIHENIIYGVFSDYTGQTFNHNTFYNNQYNIYLSTNSGSIIFKNNISSEASVYGIYSVGALIITYTDIIDSVNSLVDKSAATNLSDDPLFVNIGTDFNLKRIADGYLIDSPCLLAGDDSKDLGCYDVTSYVSTDTWKKYQLEFSPRTINLEINGKNVNAFDDSYGNKYLVGDAHKRILPFEWAGDSATSAEHRKKIEYFSTLIPTRKNGLKTDECLFRVHLQPTTFLDSGTSSTVSATGKTLTDSTKTWVENELAGWWVGIKFDYGTATGTITGSGASKTLTVTGKTWTADQWIGYYFYYGGYYYYITDNGTTTLTLDNTDGTLSNVSGISWTIEKYFKIDKNSATVLTLIDDDSELTAGTYNYYIDFMLCRINKSSFAYKQPVYNFTDQVSKTGFSIEFEEVD